MSSKKKKKKKKILYFGKWNILAPRPKNSYISGTNLQSLKNKNFIKMLSIGLYFSENIDDNTFHLFYKLNQSILLVYKYIESYFLC